MLLNSQSVAGILSASYQCYKLVRAKESRIYNLLLCSLVLSIEHCLELFQLGLAFVMSEIWLLVLRRA